MLYTLKPAGHAVPSPSPNETMALLPIMTVVAIIIGLVLPVLPLHEHLGLGLDTFMVGLVAGSQFLASILSRVFAGQVADRSGPKRAIIAGLVAAIFSGALSLASLAFAAQPLASVSVLLAGRATLGAAESFIITGAAAWGLALAGSQHAGRVIAWVGMAMFASMAAGAPLGISLYGRAASRPLRRR